MPTASSFLTLTAILICTGTVLRPATAPVPAPLTPVRQAIVDGSYALDRSHYAAAVRCFREAERLTPPDDSADMTRVQLALLGVEVMSHRYQAALGTFRRADLYAAAHQLTSARGALAMNLATLYNAQGNLAGAESALATALSFARPTDYYYSLLLLQKAQFASRRDDPDAEHLFQQAIDSADSARQDRSLAISYESLGHFRYHHGEFGPAADAFGQAVRWYGVAKQPLPASLLRGLGILQSRLGNFVDAERSFADALSRQNGRSALMPWAIYYSRARSRLLRHADADALSDLRAALDQVRRWRYAIAPTSRSQILAESQLQELYSLAVETGASLLRQRPDDVDLLAFTLQAAEENRAITLSERFLSGTDWEERLPETYWETLAQYREALSAPKPDRDSIQHWQAQLSADERSAGLKPSSESGEPRLYLAELRQRLGPGVAAFSFELGTHQSYRWALTRHSLRLEILPGRAEIARLVKDLRQAIADAKATTVRRAGAELYRTLFANIGSEERLPLWLLSVDDTLFELPFAALVTPADQYLIEQHALQFLPTIAAYAPVTRRIAGPFVAIADPVYQPADSRLPAPNVSSAPPSRSASLLPLPRLPNSAREARACIRSWSETDSIALTGLNASQQKLREALTRKPAILHFSTHFVTPAGHPDRGALALSVQADGRPALLDAAEVEQFKVPGALIVLNGCASGSGKALPGAGWLGLSRSWLTAGAQNVAAAYWPVADDEGQLWQEFYREFHTGVSIAPALALQRAQLAMLKSKTWRASPRYWAAYFLTGKG